MRLPVGIPAGRGIAAERKQFCSGEPEIMIDNHEEELIMLMPSIFSDNWFDDFMDFPFYNDRDMKRAEKKLYGRRG